MKQTILILLSSITALVFADPAAAQQTAASEADLAKQAQNPIASLISLPFQNNTNFNMGPNDRNQNVLNIQPVIPINLGPVNLITRTIVPVVYRPVYNAEHPELSIQPPIGGLPIESTTDAVWTLRFQLQLLFPR